MSAVTIYTRPLCPYCHKALKLLGKKEVEVTEIEAGFDPELKREMVEKSGGRATFPQIFIGERHVGGYDDLFDLEMDGELDPLLAALKG